jgi:hypothetical protein
VIQQPDAFVMKLGPGDNGPLDLLYSRYLGGSDADIGAAIDIDAEGYIYITGTTRSENFPVTDNNFQPVRWANADAFVVKAHPDFAPHLFYSTFVGGGDIDEGRGIAVSPRTGLIYVAGATYSSDFFPLGAAPWQPAGLGRGDIFVFQMDLSKPGGEAITNGTFLTGSDLEDVTKLILDSQDRVLVTGYTLSRDFPVTPGALQTQIAGIANVFVTRLDFSKQGAETLSYSTYLGGRDGDVAYDIALDGEGAAYVTGYTVSPDFPVTQDAIQPFSGGGIEAFLTKFAFNDGGAPGGLHYSTYLGRGGVHTGNGLVVTPNGVAYIVGQTSESHVPVTEGSYQTTFGGGPSDGFLMIINSRASQQ